MRTNIVYVEVSGTGVGRAPKTDRAQCIQACTMIEHKHAYYVLCWRSRKNAE